MLLSFDGPHEQDRGGLETERRKERGDEEREVLVVAEWGDWDRKSRRGLPVGGVSSGILGRDAVVHKCHHAAGRKHRPRIGLQIKFGHHECVSVHG